MPIEVYPIAAVDERDEDEEEHRHSSLSSGVAALEEDGVILKLALTGARIRPKGVLRVPPFMLVSTLRGFEEWEKLEGTKWTPFEVDRARLRFGTPKNNTLGENLYIGSYQLEVSVIVSREDNQAWEEKSPNVEHDDIHTPVTPRSSVSSLEAGV